MFDLGGRVALVTGASRGLGRATAMALGSAGAKLVLTDILVEGEPVDEDRPDGMGKLAASEDLVHTRETADQIVAAGGEAVAIQMDVTDPDQIDGAFAEVERPGAPSRSWSTTLRSSTTADGSRTRRLRCGSATCTSTSPVLSW